MTQSNHTSFVPLVMCALFLSGCVTMTGNYTVTAVDARGKPIDTVFQAQGRSIYTARNAICAAYPKAVVTIRAEKTGQELKSESPYQCR